MLKASAPTKDGGTLVILGLSHENVRRMREQDNPVLVDLDDLNVPGVKVMIFVGETEESMTREMMSLIGPDTNVTVDERLYGGND